MEIKLEQFFEVGPEQIYRAWLDSQEHSNMTGGEAVCSAEIGASFSCWDNYIQGKNLNLEENKRIVQSWRTDDFNEDDADSEFEITLKSKENGCVLELIHRNIPKNQPDYEQGWKLHYFEPMENYFS
jgi:activator of HSP90 ATPase